MNSSSFLHASYQKQDIKHAFGTKKGGPFKSSSLLESSKTNFLGCKAERKMEREAEFSEEKKKDLQKAEGRKAEVEMTGKC